MRKQVYIPGIEGVAPGSTATINGGVQKRLHDLDFFYTEAGVPADPVGKINRVELYVGGVLMRSLSPVEIIAIAALQNITFPTGNFTMFMSEPWRASVIGEEATSWDLFGQSSFTIEVTFDASAVSPGLQIRSSEDSARNVSGNEPFLSPVKQLSYGINTPTGSSDITTLPKTAPIQKIHLFAPSAINRVEVIRDSERVFDGTKDHNSAKLNVQGMDTTNACEFPIVFDIEQQIGSFLLVQNELNVRVDSSASQTITAVVEQRVNGYR